MSTNPDWNLHNLWFFPFFNSHIQNVLINLYLIIFSSPHLRPLVQSISSPNLNSPWSFSFPSICHRTENVFWKIFIWKFPPTYKCVIVPAGYKSDLALSLLSATIQTSLPSNISSIRTFQKYPTHYFVIYDMKWRSKITKMYFLRSSWKNSYGRWSQRKIW